MRIAVRLFGFVALLGLAAPGDSAELAQSPYAGQETRPIKALSPEDVAALRSGDGMGLAKAAELNGYPGPRHVIDLARQLQLSPQQLEAANAIRERMSAAARPLGADIVAREAALDRLFAERLIDPQRLAAATAAIGELQGRLRDVHLSAHLEMRAVLSGEQIARYAALRGYADNAVPEQHHPSGHHH